MNEPVVELPPRPVVRPVVKLPGGRIVGHPTPGPPVESAEEVDNGAEVANGAEVESGVEVERGNVRAIGGGLRPPVPSSVEPSGIPTGPTAPGNDVDVVGCVIVTVVFAPPAHAPAAIPVVPPPSKTVLDPADPMPEGAPIPPVEATPVIPLGELEQVDMPLAEGATGEMPGIVISVAPSGIPAGPTCEPAPMPSGEVVPIPGDEPPMTFVPATCATAELQPKTAANIAVVTNLVIFDSPASASLSPKKRSLVG